MNNDRKLHVTVVDVTADDFDLETYKFQSITYDARQERTAQGNLRWLCQTPISRATSTAYTTRPRTTPRRRLPKPTIQVVQYPIFAEQESAARAGICTNLL